MKDIRDIMRHSHRLTAAQFRALADAVNGRLDPFAHGSTSIAVLKRTGLIVRVEQSSSPYVPAHYVATDAGRERHASMLGNPSSFRRA